MDRTVLDWLLEDKNPEVKLRTLKEYEHYPEDKEVIEPIMSTKEDIKAHKKKIKAEKAQEKKAEKERQKAEKAEASAKTEIHSEGGDSTSADENKEVVPILDRLDTVINFAGDKLEVVTEKADKVKQKAVEGIDKAQIKIDHVVKFFEKPFTQKTIARGKKLLVKVIKSIKPKKSRADIVFGMGSPADTGAMMGKIAFIYNSLIGLRIVISTEAEITQTVYYILTFIFLNPLKHMRMMTYHKISTSVNAVFPKIFLQTISLINSFFAPVIIYYDYLCFSFFRSTYSSIYQRSIVSIQLI